MVVLVSRIERVGFVGLGNMGGPMCGHLAAAGLEVRDFDLDDAALVGSPANSNFLERDLRMVLEEGDYDEAFPMRLVTKDLGLAVDLARDVNMPVELTGLVEQIHRRARVAYGDDAGEISVVRLYEELAGSPLRLGNDEPDA